MDEYDGWVAMDDLFARLEALLGFGRLRLSHGRYFGRGFAQLRWEFEVAGRPAFREHIQPVDCLPRVRHLQAMAEDLASQWRAEVRDLEAKEVAPT